MVLLAEDFATLSLSFDMKCVTSGLQTYFRATDRHEVCYVRAPDRLCFSGGHLGSQRSVSKARPAGHPTSLTFYNRRRHKAMHRSTALRNCIHVGF